MFQEETVTVRYTGFCVPKGKMEDMKQFDYTHQAPASICKPPATNDLHVWVDSVVKSHQDEIIHDRAWPCFHCDKTAKGLLSIPSPILWSVPGLLDISESGPVINDLIFPVCVLGGVCDREADKLLREAANPGSKLPIQVSLSCQKCGKWSNYRPCSDCKVVGYCSKDCKDQHWPAHKEACRLARLEQEKIENDAEQA